MGWEPNSKTPDIEQWMHEAYPSRADVPSCTSQPEPRRIGLALWAPVNRRLGLRVASCRSGSTLRRAVLEFFENDCAYESRNNPRGRRQYNPHIRAKQNGNAF